MKTRLSLLLAIAAIVAVCGITALCFAQKRARAGTTPVLEKSFKDTLENIIWSDTVLMVSVANKFGVKELEGKKGTEKLKVFYPKVVFVTKNGKPYHSSYNNTTAIRFLDINGKIKKELLPIPRKLDFNGINISKNKKYICITTWTERKFLTIFENHELDMPLYESAVYNTDGLLLRTIKQINSYAKVSPNGEYIMDDNAEYSDYPLSVYNERGLVKEIKKDETGYGLDFASDGSWYAITVEVKDTSNFDLSALLLVIDKNGKELWRKERLAWGSAAFCQVSIMNDKMINVTTGKDDYDMIKIYTFDKTGILLETKQVTVDQLREMKK